MKAFVFALKLNIEKSLLMRYRRDLLRGHCCTGTLDNRRIYSIDQIKGGNIVKPLKYKSMVSHR